MAKLKEVCTFYSGTGFPTKYQGNDEGEYAFYKVSDIANNVQLGNTYLSVCNNYISGEIAKEIKGCILPKDTVVFAKIGEAVKLNRRAITSADCLIDNNAMGLAPIQDKLRLDYFFYYMRNLKMEKLAESTTVPSVRKSLLEELEIKVPSLEEQKEIGEILDKVSVVIQTRKQEIEQLDLLIKARFVEMFGDLANPECLWDKSKLIDVCADKDDIKCGPFGTQLNKDEYMESGIAVWEIPQINAAFLTKPIHFLTEEKAEQLKAYTIIPGDIAMSRKGNVGKCALFPDDYPEGIIHSDVLRIRVDCKRVNSLFMMCQLHFSGMVTRQIELVSSGAIMAGVNVTKLKQIYIYVPPMELQNQFADFVRVVDKSKVAVQKSLDETQLLFDSLMQKYFW